MPALSFRERLSGALVLVGDAARELRLTLNLKVRIESSLLGRHARAVVAPPALVHADVSGVGVYDRATRTLAYRLRFASEDGRSGSLELRRRLELENLYTSLTVVSGELRDADDRVFARCMVRFDPRGDLGAFFSSLRFAGH
jgi:hypothetical protein